MNLDYHKNFRKGFEKLRPGEKKRVNEALHLFALNPYNPRLRNHALRGKMKDKRAIWAGGDLRLIFREYEKYTMVLFLSVGSHNQIY